MALTVTFSVAPVPTNVPPQVPLYHFQVPPVPKLPPVTLKVTVAGPQSIAGDAVAPVGSTESELTVIDVVAVTAEQPPAAAKV